MRVLLDTCAYRDFVGGEPHAVEVLRSSRALYVPFVVLAELRAGFLCGDHGSENEKSLIRFLSKSCVEVLLADEETTHHYARLFRQLRTQGMPIPTNDLWIAALAVQHNLGVCTRDAHFTNLPQITRV
jgi:predicted nucleic acid-binding protein